MNISTVLTFNVDTVKLAKEALKYYNETELPIMECINTIISHQALLARFENKVLCHAILENKDQLATSILADMVILRMIGLVGD